MKDEIKEESMSHDCPVGGISLSVLTKEEAKMEDKMAECYFDKASTITGDLQEAFNKSEMVIILLYPEQNAYGPIYGYERKLRSIEIKEIAEKHATMFKHREEL